MFQKDKFWEKTKIYLWETWKKHIMCFSDFSFRNTFCVSMGKTLWNHKMCLLMGFSGGNTTQRQQWRMVVSQEFGISHCDKHLLKRLQRELSSTAITKALEAQLRPQEGLRPCLIRWFFMSVISWEEMTKSWSSGKRDEGTVEEGIEDANTSCWWRWSRSKPTERGLGGFILGTKVLYNCWTVTPVFCTLGCESLL